MFEAFAKNYIAEEQRIESGILDRIAAKDNGSLLWAAFRRSWPLQVVKYNITSATPRKLSGLGTILLHIYQVMDDDPPDSQTIAAELGIGDSFFIDEQINELARISAVKKDQNGRTAITAKGRDYLSLGRIPGARRKQKISLCFDPVGHDFPQEVLFCDDEQAGGETSGLQYIVEDYHPADANRIDIDTIRQVACRQGFLADKETMIIDAEPDEGQQEVCIYPRQVYVLVFLDNDRITLRIHDPQSKDASKWFQQAIDNCLQSGSIDFSHLLGPLTADDTGGAETNGDIDGLSFIPVHHVREKIVTAVSQAKESVDMHTFGCGDNTDGNRDELLNAIVDAADRGIRCRLLWNAGRTKTNGSIPDHENIFNLIDNTGSNGMHEFLVVDGRVCFAAAISKLKLPSASSAASVLTVHYSKDKSVCQKLKQKITG